jgi:hypothetical protein
MILSACADLRRLFCPFASTWICYSTWLRSNLAQGWDGCDTPHPLFANAPTIWARGVGSPSSVPQLAGWRSTLEWTVHLCSCRHPLSCGPPSARLVELMLARRYTAPRGLATTGGRSHGMALGAIEVVGPFLSASGLSSFGHRDDTVISPLASAAAAGSARRMCAPERTDRHGEACARAHRSIRGKTP